jgi:hypothetical protein
MVLTGEGGGGLHPVLLAFVAIPGANVFMSL